MDTRLRVGLLLDSVHIPAWTLTAIERMIRSNCAELALVVLNQSSSLDRSERKLIGRNSAYWLYRVFNAIDERLFLHGPNALEVMDAAGVLLNVPRLLVQPVVEDQRQQLAATDVEKIRSYHLDVLVEMGFGKMQGDVLSAATYGIWTYRWGDSRRIEDGLTGFWEVSRAWPETGAALQQLGTNAEHTVTLFESWFFTYPYSPARNRNYVLWAAASFLPRQVECLHRLGGEKYFRERQGHEDRALEALESNKIPSNVEVLWIMVRLAIKNLREAYDRKFHPTRWELLYSFEPEAEKKIASFKRATPPKDRFWADPHVIYQGTKYYVFVEEYPYQTRRGHIAVMEIDQGGDYKPPVTVLREDYHLSFPFVFPWKGRYYMIPESSENKTIDLYECMEFPYRWQRKLTLMKNIKAVDTTVVYRQGKWWLFTAIAEQQAAAPQVELFLFSSNELFTDQWNPHPMNPIVSDVKRARGAGGIFIKDGRLFRPSQYGSSVYGHGFDLNEIVCLSETEYCERTVTMVRPEGNPGIMATHTYAKQGNLTVIDALTHRPKWAKTS